MESKASILLDGLAFPEGPRWRDGRLWFSDMHDLQVKTVDLQGRVEDQLRVEGSPSGLGWLPDGRLLVVSMTDRRLLRLDPEGLVTHADLSELATFDCNDMVTDASGRSYVGNFGFDIHVEEPKIGPAELILVSASGEARVAAGDLLFPNGTVITDDGRTLIVGESYGARLSAFDIGDDGTLSNRRVWAQLEGAVPDGICLDAQGAIWVASPLGNQVLAGRRRWAGHGPGDGLDPRDRLHARRPRAATPARLHRADGEPGRVSSAARGAHRGGRGGRSGRRPPLNATRAARRILVTQAPLDAQASALEEPAKRSDLGMAGAASRITRALRSPAQPPALQTVSGDLPQERQIGMAAYERGPQSLAVEGSGAQHGAQVASELVRKGVEDRAVGRIAGLQVEVHLPIAVEQHVLQRGVAHHQAVLAELECAALSPREPGGEPLDGLDPGGQRPLPIGQEVAEQRTRAVLHPQRRLRREPHGQRMRQQRGNIEAVFAP